MLGCARIGAIHSVVFGGFSPDSLRDRINDAKAKLLITADIGYRRGNQVPLKKNSDTALEGTDSIEHVIVVKRDLSGTGTVNVAGAAASAGQRGAPARGGAGGSRPGPPWGGPENHATHPRAP